MAYLAEFAYHKQIEAKGELPLPNELAQLGFEKITSFHNGMRNGWAYVAEGKDLIVPGRAAKRSRGGRKGCNAAQHGDRDLA